MRDPVLDAAPGEARGDVILMYDELIERLRRCASYDPRFVIQDCEDAADAIEDLSKTLDEEVEINTALECNMPVWIPVAERLPEETTDGFSDDVLMFIEQPDGDITWRDVYVGYYLYDACSDEVGWWVKMTCDCTKVGEHKHGNKIYKANEYVTHWMPLPQPPKDGE